jgi:hypothetical protein
MMFAFNRSALAVIAPLALLVGVVMFSNQANEPPAAQQAEGSQAQALDSDQTVAANFPSR